MSYMSNIFKKFRNAINLGSPQMVTMQRIILLMLFLVLGVGQANAQSCFLIELPLQERVQQSTLIVEGRVVASAPFANSSGSLINTAHEIEVTAIRKGQVTTQRIYVITEGGQLGQKLQVVEPALSLQVGDKGLFLLHAAQFDGQPQQYPAFQPIGGPQGFVQFMQNGIARDPFTLYQQPQQELFQPIQQWTQQSPQIMQPLLRQPMPQRGAAPVINGFSPATITAGTFSTFTITGSGFGTQSGQAEIAFSNANDGGATFLPVPSSLIQAWSNTQIRVQVPTDAGSGPIRITDASGAQTVSSTAVSIPYSVATVDVNGNLYRTFLKDINTNGGLTLQYNNNFTNYPDAVAAFERALTSWRCGSFINFSVSNAPTNVACQNQDGISVVNWDTACALPSGVLGQTRSHFSFCATPSLTIYLDDVDLIFAKQPNTLSWNLGPGSSSNQQFDFESVALHELGHAHQLTHVIEPSEIMHFAIGPGTDKRVLSQPDINGGSDVLNFSSTSTCGPAAMQLLSSGNCGLGSSAAAFVGVPQQGCAPQEVFFFDQSSGNPTSWQWDIDNDGVVDYTAKNISHTYTQPGTYDVRLVVESAGGFDTVVQQQYITIRPELIAEAGPDTFVCSGGSVQLLGSGAGGDGDYVVEWTPSTGLNSNQLFAPTASPAATTVYVIEVTDGTGCVDTDSVTVTVVPSPTANAGLDDNVCQGTSITLGGSPTASGGTGAYTYTWQPEGLGIPAVSNPIVAPGKTTIYTVVVADSLGCTDEDTVEISIAPLPKADAGPGLKVCGGNRDTLGGNPTASGGAGGFTYLWLPNQNISSTAAANPTFNATSGGVITYTLQVFDSKGCQASDTVEVTSLPPVGANAGANATICAGASVTLDGAPTGEGGTGMLTYQWSPATGLNDPTSDTPEASPGTTTTYTVTVQDDNLCTATDSVTVTINPTPMADAGTDKGLCDGITGSTTIGGSPSGSGGTGTLTYSWSPSSGLSDPAIANPTAAPGQPATYVLTVTDANGCSSSDTMRVTINPPLVARAGTRDSVCQDACLTIGASPSAVGGDGNFAYQWSPATGLDDSTRANPQACPGATTTYTLEVTDGKGCTSKDTIIVVIKPAPTVTFGVLDTSYCENDAVVNLAGTPPNGNFSGTGVTANTFDPGVAGLGAHTLYYTVVNAEGCSAIDSAITTVHATPPKPTIFVRNDTLFTDNGYADYQWLFNGISIANANDSFLYRPAGQLPGNYEVIVTNDNGCTSRSDVFNYTDVAPVWAAMDAKLFPNPASQQAFLQIEMDRAEAIHIRVFDGQGRRVWHAPPATITQQQYTLPVSTWSAGLYVIAIQGESGQRQLPLIVE